MRVDQGFFGVVGKGYSIDSGDYLYLIRENSANRTENCIKLSYCYVIITEIANLLCLNKNNFKTLIDD